MPGSSTTRNGAATSSSSRSRGDGVIDLRMRAVIIKGLTLLGETFDWDFLKDGYTDCKFMAKMYKECVSNDGYNCGFYIKDCPEFHKAEFLRTASSSKSKTNG